VNCAALPRELLESELFGHERGAFTGAVARKLGKFELASGGTLLLDEVSEMEPALQAKLLRVLQEHEVDRVGGTRPVPIDTRVIATTNRALGPLVASGAFRRDLYYRLHVIPLTLPPLRERREDIDLLVEHFCARFARGARPPALDPAARDYLQRHPWPGNVRELEHVVERALLLAAGPVITRADLALEEELRPVGGSASLAGLTVHEVERRLILETLQRTNNNRSHAARMLGISVRTLRNKLAEYRVAREPGPCAP
jgi:two-component system response regulator FlrC